VDELQLLIRARPEPAPPTAVERAAIRTAVVEHIAGSGAAARIEGPGWDDVPTGRPGPSRGTRLAVVAAAVLVVVAAMVGALALGDDERGVEQTPVDDPAPPATYPVPPYTVEVLVSAEATGGTSPARSVDGRLLLHQVDAEVGVADMTGCMQCDGTMLMLHLGEVPAEGPPADVRAAVEGVLADATEAGPRLAAIESLLSDPDTGPTVRAELLGALSRTEGLVVEDDVTTALGAVGTRYTASSWTRYESTHSVVVDPVDGYVLEVHGIDGPDPGSTAELVSGPAGSFAPDAQIETRISYGRPVVADRLPADVRQLAQTVLATSSSRPGPGSCATASGNERDGVAHVFPLPSHLAYAHCPTS
jgi:hypothetical protein